MDDILIELQMASQVHMPTHEHISLCGQAADEIETLRGALTAAMDDGEMWRLVAIALTDRLADEVSDPTCGATLAYNAARNRRPLEAVEHARRAVKSDE